MLKLLLKIGTVVSLIKETREAYAALMDVYREAQKVSQDGTPLGRAIKHAMVEGKDIEKAWDKILGEMPTKRT
tara:strand:+ start:1381 stop:1599 length:219 start_codon:yes stop_codon:yes gene_type:complete